MPRYNVTVEIVVEAKNEKEAWELVATPFHNGSIANDQPHWKHPFVASTELLGEEFDDIRGYEIE